MCCDTYTQIVVICIIWVIDSHSNPKILSLTSIWRIITVLIKGILPYILITHNRNKSYLIAIWCIKYNSWICLFILLSNNLSKFILTICTPIAKTLTGFHNILNLYTAISLVMYLTTLYYASLSSCLDNYLVVNLNLTHNFSFFFTLNISFSYCLQR